MIGQNKVKAKHKNICLNNMQKFQKNQTIIYPVNKIHYKKQLWIKTTLKNKYGYIWTWLWLVLFISTNNSSPFIPDSLFNYVGVFSWL
jgi:hypothetical protein